MNEQQLTDDICYLYDISDDVAGIVDWNGMDHVTFTNATPSGTVVGDGLVRLCIDVTDDMSTVVNDAASAYTDTTPTSRTLLSASV